MCAAARGPAVQAAGGQGRPLQGPPQARRAWLHHPGNQGNPLGKVMERSGLIFENFCS